ncbi:hypothetical protein C8R44DRAFT_164574, partial [Mycena epipterygia]
MILINSKKYACETCTQGPRSSACKHTDRPLFEIKARSLSASTAESCAKRNKLISNACARPESTCHPLLPPPSRRKAPPRCLHTPRSRTTCPASRQRGTRTTMGAPLQDPAAAPSAQLALPPATASRTATPISPTT